MVIPVYGVSEGEALCDWIYESRDEPRRLGVKIQNPDRFHQGGTLNSRKGNPKYQISSSARQ